MIAPDREDMLQQYFDGELPPPEADAVRAALADDEELRAKLDGLEHLRTLLRAVLAPERVTGVDSDALFASIRSRLDEDEGEVTEAPDAAPPRLRAIEGGADEEPAERRGSAVWMGVVGGVLAAAAAVWFLVIRPGDPVGETETPRDPIAGHVIPSPGSEIEEIDFGYSTGAIFQIEGREGASYAVIWISDEKPPDEVDPPEESSP